MARNADMVRDGQDALHNQEQEAQGGDFSSIPHIEQPRPREVQGFPVFSQMFHEIGTIAEVVDQINRISDFIAGRPVPPPAESQPAGAQPEQPVQQPQEPAPQPQAPASVQQPPQNR